MPFLKLPPIAIAALGLTLAGCAVGPDYKGPPTGAPQTLAAGRFHRAGELETTAPPPARWWEALGDPTLSRLIDMALADSPTLREAEARMRSARAGLSQSRVQLLPSGQGSALAVGARLPTGALGAFTGSGGGGSANVALYTAGFDATWELDLFGGTRRSIETASARAGAQDAQAQDAQVQLAAEVGQAYVNLRDAQTRLTLSRKALDLQRQTLDLVQQRRTQGAAADGDVERARGNLEQTEAQIAPLAAQVDQFTDQLSVLTGREPGALDAMLAEAAPVPAPPAVTPVGDPSAWLRRRPDIRAAERRLAASNAQIGQQIAQLFPTVSLLGDIGFAGSDAGQLFKSSNLATIGAPSLSWKILNYPRIHAQIQGAKADRDATAADYQATVLQALQDAEGALSRFSGQRRSVLALMRAQASNDRAADLIAQRYRGGTASLIDLLDAQRRQIEARQSLAQGQAQLTIAYIALQKSLGLGWGESRR